MTARVRLRSEEETRAFGRALAEILPPGTIAALTGVLGAGKTRLVKGIAEGLSIDPDDVSSPTFTMIAEYHGAARLVHVDLYRLETEGDAEGIGLPEVFAAGAWCAVEWADRLPGLVPATVGIDLGVTGESEREAVVTFEKAAETSYISALRARGFFLETV